MNHKYYAGVGSRRTPKDVCELMTQIARYLYFKGYTLRSGGADGADSAFEIGAGEKKEIFLPFEGFNNSESKFFNPPDKAFKIVEKLHPAWEKCKPHVRCFHARNVQQVLGKNLDNPSDFVVCWTRNGKLVGGTAMSIRIAREYDIPVFNLAIEEDKNRITKGMKDASK